MSPSDSTLIRFAARWSLTRAATLLFTACGLMKTKAEWVLHARETSRSARRFSGNTGWSVCALAVFSGSPANASILCKHCLASRSSNRSNSACLSPSNTISGLVNQYSTVDCDTLAAKIALPKGSSATFAPIQLMRSARASKGLADAWMPLSPVSGQEGKPKADHSSKRTLRKECCSAAIGSVAPTILLRKVCHDRRFGSHSASM
mmetsp:Transcript_64408/g.191896  ORF Transcript_64408/g.191896 Transcript_64408/m.191896 type:complete len:205 (-) Transcript_64408:488-1102(-)